MYTEFRRRVDELDQIDWAAVAATDFRDSGIKEGKQAEVLVQDFVPWQLVRRIGVMSMRVLHQAMRDMSGAGHRPRVEVCRTWYF